MNPKILVVLLFFVSGCAASYGCPAPEGVRCQRISDVYASTQKNRFPPKEAKQYQESRPIPLPERGTGEKTTPLRTAPKILRVWIAPWIDQDGDLHKEGDLFLVVHSGEWAIGESIPKEAAIRRKEIIKAPSSLSSNSPEEPNRDFPVPKVSPKEETHEP